MNPRRTNAALYLTAAISALASVTPAMAQETALSEVVVTARRVEERLQDVPISITVFNQEQLSSRNITNPSELATYTPALTANNRYGPEKSAFAIRGFTQDGPTAPSVAVYFADVVAPRASGGTTSGNNIAIGQIFDLQNVQVLKGPQGTLFGRNTTGGAVLFVPQKPVDRFEGYVEGSVGNYDMRRLQAVVNVPVGDTFRVRAGFDRMKRDGYLQNKSNIGPRRFDDSDYWAGRLSMVADITPNLENYSVATYSNSDTNGNQPRLAICDRNAELTGVLPQLYRGPACAQIDRQIARGDSFYDVENNNPDAFEKLKQWQLINTTTWVANDQLTVKNIISYSQFRERASFSLSGENFGEPYPQYVILSTAPGIDTVAQDTFTEELQFQGRMGQLTWQAGAYLEVSNPLGFSGGWAPILLDCKDLQALQCTDPFGALFSSLTGQDVRFGSISNSATKTYFNNKALYAQATYAFTDQLSLTGGLRYTWDKVRQVSQYRKIQFPAVAPAGSPPVFVCNDPRIPGDATDQSVCRQTFRQSSSKPTWLIDLDYKPTSDVLFYGKYARGYRQGGVNSLNVGLETWGPEKVDAVEIGAKTNFSFLVRGYFNIAAFYNDFRDQQIQANLIARAGSGFAGGNAIINAGKSEIKGFEVDTSINPIQGLRFDIGYAYLDTKVKKLTPPAINPALPFEAIVPTATVGSPLALSPKNRVTVTGSYTLPLTEDVGEITLSANYIHTDKQVASLVTPIGVLPANDLVNLNLNWNEVLGRPVDLALFATNVTKQKFPVNVGTAYTSTGFDTYILNQPRMYGVRLRYRFGS